MLFKQLPLACPQVPHNRFLIKINVYCELKSYCENDKMTFKTMITVDSTKSLIMWVYIIN